MTVMENEVRGRVFRTPNDKMAAKRDERRILLLEEKTDFNNAEAVSKLLKDLESGRYSFETLLGQDFIEEVEEKLELIKNNPPVVETKKSSRKKTVKGSSDKRKKEKIKTNNKEKNFEDYDAVMQQHIMDELKKHKKQQKFIYVLLSLVAVVCLSYVIFYYAQYEKNSQEYNSLAELKKEDSQGVSNEPSFTLVSTDKEMPPILAKYETLYQKNKRIVGWIKIEGTKIDYPVMQTVNNEYYLDHNYNQEYDKNGSIFMDKDCTPAFPNTNMIIYGHHMKSGKMFGNLNYYSKESYYKEHPQIIFDTIYEEGVYDIMYVFRSKIYNEDEIVFKYYQFIDVNSADEFYSAMDEMSRMSLYDTGVSASYGDKLITLSTCDNSEEDGRFVVVAKKVK